MARPWPLERCWQACDLNDEDVLGDAMTWLTRRRQAACGWPDLG
jgi:hypothetical protein